MKPIPGIYCKRETRML